MKSLWLSQHNRLKNFIWNYFNHNKNSKIISKFNWLKSEKTISLIMRKISYNDSINRIFNMTYIIFVFLLLNFVLYIANCFYTSSEWMQSADTSISNCIMIVSVYKNHSNAKNFLYIMRWSLFHNVHIPKRLVQRHFRS
jgi:hypothetical protein